MATLTEVLTELVKIEGIGAAVVVSRDGFVIESASNGSSLDMDAVGAVVSAGIGASEVMGTELHVGAIQQSMVEYDNGIIVATLLGNAATLAIVADIKANLGNVRYQVKKRVPAIVSFL
jgi:uncharacterized protein